VVAFASRFVSRFVKAAIVIASMHHNHDSLLTGRNVHQQRNCHICETPGPICLYHNNQRKSVSNINYRQQFNFYIFWSSWQPIIRSGTSNISFLYAQNCAQGMWGKCVHCSSFAMDNSMNKPCDNAERLFLIFVVCVLLIAYALLSAHMYRCCPRIECN
jgi:hypothetical protein